MTTGLYIAAFLIVAIGLAHSYLGERYILIRLFRRDDLPKLFGSSEFTVRTLRFAVVILESLAPDEFVGFELLSVNAELPNLVTVRSEQCVAKYVEMFPQPAVKPWVLRLAAILMAAGAGLAIYLILLLLQFLIVGTPYGH